jgi:hypothetical protein
MNPGEYLNGMEGPDWQDTEASLSPTILTFDEERASAFAKTVARDFNPLHDVGQSRFCVPGDLLFAALVSRYGLYADTSISFANMLPARASLALPASIDKALQLIDERDRQVLSLFTNGDQVKHGAFAQQLVTEYVRFSGRTFPDLLVPMMRESGVMINPSRPLVIYKDMALRVDAALINENVDKGLAVTLVPLKQLLSVNDKKGAAKLQFSIELNGVVVGEGEKHFVLGGLRAFDEASIATLVSEYQARKRNWDSGLVKEHAIGSPQ